MILAELFEDLFQFQEVSVVHVGMHQEVVDVDDHILKVSKYPLH